MSGQRKTWNDGEALTTVELQRVADVAASSEDRVWNLLLTPGNAGAATYDKRVYPILLEPPTANYLQGRALVYGGSVAIAGGVNVLPATYVIGGTSNSATDANTVNLSAEQAAMVQLSATSFPTSVGNGYVATVYALIQRVATTQARKVKDTVTGAVSTQTITIYTDATVQIGVALGPADGTMAAPTLPADSTTAWYVPLANVTLGGVGSPWTAGTTITQAMITQTWNAGWIRRNRVQLAAPASIMGGAYGGAGVNGRASTPLSARWGASISVTAVLQHATAAAATYVVLDNTYDWSRRIINIEALSVLSQSASSFPPDDLTSGNLPVQAGHSLIAGPLLTGDKTIVRTQMALWDVDGSGNHKIAFHHNAGVMEVEFVQTPYLTTLSGYTTYVVTITGSDQFLL